MNPGKDNGKAIPAPAPTPQERLLGDLDGLRQRARGLLPSPVDPNDAVRLEIAFDSLGRTLKSVLTPPPPLETADGAGPAVRVGTRR
jgi:hypothetical protein